MSSKIINEATLIHEISCMKLKETNVAIVGGHYMLFYDRDSDSLQPLIYDDLTGNNKIFAKVRATDFPTRSFSWTIKLLLYFRLQKIEAKCVLLVNDDSLSRNDFRNISDLAVVKERGTELRKKYFSSDSNLPKAFSKILIKYGLAFQSTFQSFDNLYEREENGKTKSTVFVSERRLCKNFKKTFKKLSVSDKLFRTFKAVQNESNEITELSLNPDSSNTLCLIEAGICNCGGKAFQFYYDLISKGFTTIIFFLPNECSEQVNMGADLIAHLEEFSHKKITLINISNIQGNPEEETTYKDIFLSFYNTYPGIGGKT